MITTRIGACLLAATLVVGACGGDDDDTSNVTVPTDPTTTTSTTVATTTTTEDPKAAIEQAFYDQWDAFVTILENPDPANPLIDNFFTGPARETLLDTISSDIQEGYTTRKPDDPSLFKPGVESIELVSASEARLVECTVDGLIVSNRDTGEVVNDRVSTVRLENEFVLEDGQWKVRLTKRLDRRDGVAPCD